MLYKALNLALYDSSAQNHENYKKGRLSRFIGYEPDYKITDFLSAPLAWSEARLSFLQNEYKRSAIQA